MAKQVQIKFDEIPDGWSQDAADLINKVIIKLNFKLKSILNYIKNYLK